MTAGAERWWRRLLVARRDGSTARGAAPTAVGERFALRAQLGRGAGSTVWLADDRRRGTTVALKLIALPEGMPAAQRDDWRVAFAREAMAAARLRHPDIVALLDAGVVTEGGWLALEYVPGCDLGRYTRPAQLLPDALALSTTARLARALAHAHRAGIVHRDLKPSNVRIDLARGVLKLTDFGVARVPDAALTRTGLMLGTPAYMAPELLAGVAATAAADTWALGVLAFELLAGRRPLPEAASFGELLRAIAHDEPAPLAALRPDLPPAVGVLVAQALQRDPNRRPRDLDAWAQRLDDAALAARTPAR